MSTFYVHIRAYIFMHVWNCMEDCAADVWSIGISQVSYDYEIECIVLYWPSNSSFWHWFPSYSSFHYGFYFQNSHYLHNKTSESRYELDIQNHYYTNVEYFQLIQRKIKIVKWGLLGLSSFLYFLSIIYLSLYPLSD